MTTRSLLAWMAALLLLTPASAAALTVEEVLDLHRAGVGEATLQAQIEATGATYALTAGQIKALKGAGLSEPFIRFLIRTRAPAPARTFERAPEYPAYQRAHEPLVGPSSLYAGYYPALHYPSFYYRSYSPFDYGYRYRSFYRSYGPGFVYSRGGFRFSFTTRHR